MFRGKSGPTGSLMRHTIFIFMLLSVTFCKTKKKSDPTPPVGKTQAQGLTPENLVPPKAKVNGDQLTVANLAVEPLQVGTQQVAHITLTGDANADFWKFSICQDRSEDAVCMPTLDQPDVFVSTELYYPNAPVGHSFIQVQACVKPENAIDSTKVCGPSAKVPYFMAKENPVDEWQAAISKIYTSLQSYLVPCTEVQNQVASYLKANPTVATGTDSNSILLQNSLNLGEFNCTAMLQNGFAGEIEDEVNKEMDAAADKLVANTDATTTTGTSGNNPTPTTAEVGRDENEVDTLETPTTPAITSVSYSEGSAPGTLSIAIEGSNFQDNATVTVDAIPCTTVTVTDSNNISCTLPTPKANTVASVRVTTGGETATLTDGFDYTATTPVNPNNATPELHSITKVSYLAGSVTGTLSIAIEGSNFQKDAITTVTVGTIACTPVTVTDSNNISCTLPIPQADTVAAVRVTIGENTAILANGFTYTAPVIANNNPNNPTPGQPSITKVSHSAGVDTRTLSIAIEGSHFQKDATVTVGSVSCTPVIFNNSNNISCTLSTPQTDTVAAVTVTIGENTATLTNGFTYIAPIIANNNNSDTTATTDTAENSSRGSNTGEIGGGVTIFALGVIAGFFIGRNAMAPASSKAPLPAAIDADPYYNTPQDAVKATAAAAANGDIYSDPRETAAPRKTAAPPRIAETSMDFANEQQRLRQATPRTGLLDGAIANPMYSSAPSPAEIKIRSTQPTSEWHTTRGAAVMLRPTEATYAALQYTYDASSGTPTPKNRASSEYANIDIRAIEANTAARQTPSTSEYFNVETAVEAKTREQIKALRDELSQNPRDLKKATRELKTASREKLRLQERQQRVEKQLVGLKRQPDAKKAALKKQIKTTEGLLTKTSQSLLVVEAKLAALNDRIRRLNPAPALPTSTAGVQTLSTSAPKKVASRKMNGWHGGGGFLAIGMMIVGVLVILDGSGENVGFRLAGTAPDKALDKLRQAGRDAFARARDIDEDLNQATIDLLTLKLKALEGK